MNHDNPTVLIVGCGPTGLILTHELLRRGVNCRVVDKRMTPSGTTRAFTIHSRTMEMFDHMGLAHRIEELREICPGNIFHFYGADVSEDKIPVLDFRRLKNTRYNYYGKVNQNDLEQSLRESLAGKYSVYPEWATECQTIKQEDDQITVVLQNLANGQQETVRPQWLIGADGVHSTVRKQLGLMFDENESYDMTMSMVDVELDGYKGDDNWVNYYVNQNSFVLLTRLPNNKHRLYLAGAMEGLLNDYTPEQAFQKGLDAFDTGAQIKSMDWSSTWQIHKIIAESYSKERVFLCGDATHVHSPNGGQGMNACMQDAFNLGWKLAAVINRHAPESILSTYEQERRPIAEQVTAGANRMHEMLFNNKININDRYQLSRDPQWHDETIYRISGLSHNYCDVLPIPEGVTLLDDGINVGERAADAILSKTPPKRRLHDILRHTGFTLLVLPNTESESESNNCEELVDRLYARYGDNVRCVAICDKAVDGFDFDHHFIDHTGEVNQVYGKSEQGRMILIRPDLYVAYRSLITEQKPLMDHLDFWLSGQH